VNDRGFPKPSRKAFAEVDGDVLVAWIHSGELDEVDLSFACEALGEKGDGAREMLALLDRREPLVREGAVIGLEKLVHAILDRLAVVRDNDTSKGVKAAAGDALRFIS
jgi:hypothetical protein